TMSLFIFFSICENYCTLSMIAKDKQNRPAERQNSAGRFFTGLIHFPATGPWVFAFPAADCRRLYAVQAAGTSEGGIGG
ncbi:MAG: hypothetical protein ACLRIN_06745, partial [Lawsonibacter sp.]